MTKAQQNLELNLQRYTINDNKDMPSTLILIIVELNCNDARKKFISNLKNKESSKIKAIAVNIDNKLLLSKVSKVIGQVKKTPMSCPNKPVPLNAGFKREGTTIKYSPVNSSKKKQIKTVLSFSITASNKQPEKEKSLGRKSHKKFNLNLIK